MKDTINKGVLVIELKSGQKYTEAERNNSMAAKLTEKGKKKAENFTRELKALQKEIVDAGKDTADRVILPTIEDIESDIGDALDEYEDYINSWNATDNDYDLPLHLFVNDDFTRKSDD